MCRMSIACRPTGSRRLVEGSFCPHITDYMNTFSRRGDDRWWVKNNSTVSGVVTSPLRCISRDSN